jgi:hypothetical protein
LNGAINEKNAIGADGALLKVTNNIIYHVNFIEKIQLRILLHANFIPEGGIWLGILTTRVEC